MVELLTGQDGDTYGFKVLGRTFYFLVDANAFYVGAVEQNVTITGSPTVSSFDPPIAPPIDLGAFYRFVMGLL